MKGRVPSVWIRIEVRLEATYFAVFLIIVLTFLQSKPYLRLRLTNVLCSLSSGRSPKWYDEESMA